MYYTVLNKSGWTSDTWHVYGTYTVKKDADFAAYGIKSPHAKDSTYHTTVKAHKKEIAKLTDWENQTVKFSDGTVAVT